MLESRLSYQMNFIVDANELTMDFATPYLLPYTLYSKQLAMNSGEASEVFSNIEKKHKQKRDILIGLLTVGCVLVVLGVALLVTGLRGNKETTPGGPLQAHFITSLSTDEQVLDTKEGGNELNASNVTRDSFAEESKENHGINS